MSRPTVDFTADREPLVDAMDRLLDRLFQDHGERVRTDLPLREAVELARRAYCRERMQRNELWSDFPVLTLDYEERQEPDDPKDADWYDRHISWFGDAGL